MTQIEKIVAEIERLMKWKPKAIPSGMRQRDVLNIRKGVLLTLKDFIKYLPAEQPSEDFKGEFDDYLVHGDIRNPNFEGPFGYDDIRKTAIHFANWQKNQTINKACEWLRYCIDVDDEVKMIDGEPEAESFIQKNIHRIKVTNQIVEEFKKAMEDK